MELSKKEKDIKNKALQYIRNNEAELISKFADKENHPPKEEPSSFFTAGSFGAGKTEFSKRLAEEHPDIVLIDADEIRKLCPDYDGERAYIFNAAAFVGQEKLHDYTLKHSQHFVFDSSFSNYDKAKENIKRSLDKNRSIDIYFVYQHPKVAWLFTQVRAQLSGRHISKQAFIDSFIESKKVTGKIKREFGNDVTLNLVEKSTSSSLTDIEHEDINNQELDELRGEIIRKNVILDIEKIDKYIDFDFSKSGLKKEWWWSV